MTELQGMRRLPFPWPVACWQIDLDEPALDATGELLDDEERARAARFVRPGLAIRYRRAHGALRWLLGRHCGADGADLRFETNAHGKPALRPGMNGGAPGSRRSPALPQFNLSHSAGHALVAICDDAPVGVDIEALRDIGNLDDWAGTQLSEREKAQWRTLPDADRVAAFLCGWTRKEATLKAMGVGLAQMAPARIDVGLEPLAGPVALEPAGWRLRWLGPLDCEGAVVASLAVVDAGADAR